MGNADGPCMPCLLDVLVLLVAGLGLLALFAVWQRYIEKKESILPLVPLGIFALDGGRISLLFLIAVSQRIASTA
jgi:hypothetical protein